MNPECIATTPSRRFSYLTPLKPFASMISLKCSCGRPRPEVQSSRPARVRARLMCGVGRKEGQLEGTSPDQETF